MPDIIVKNQTELDAALQKTGYVTVYVESAQGEWLDIKNTPDRFDIVVRGSATVHASGSATVHASGSATVHAWDSATVHAWDSATVRAWGSATVRAWGSATVHASGSATVHASGSATVHASGSATVHAWGSATVRAWGSATVRAWGSATVHAWGSATVRAWGSATVHAWGSATVHAKNAVSVTLHHRATADVGPLVSVHLHSNRAKATGGQQIIVPAIHTVQDWVNYHGVEKRGDHLVVFKAVRDNLKSKHGALYAIGTEVVAPDWRAEDSCGNGLHFSASVREARTYDEEATRFLKCLIPIAETVVIGQGEASVDKVKARKCFVLEEVDEDDQPLTIPTPAPEPKKPRKNAKKASA